MQIDRLSKVFRYATFITMAQVAGLMTYCAIKEPLQPVDRIISEDSFEKHKNILIADDFKRASISVDADLIPEISHGFVTSGLIEQGLENANVIKRNVTPSFSEVLSKNKTTHANFNTLFNALSEKPKIFDVINLSCGVDIKIKKLAEELKMNLTAENLAEKQQEIKNAMNNYKGDYKIFGITLDKIAKFINLMDTISAKGTRFYISAGNSGKEYVNLLNLTNNSINVGALNYKGEKTQYSSDNSLINRWEDGDVFFKKVEDGYDFTDDNIAEVKFDQVALPIKLKANPFEINGTSFSCPRAIVRDLRDKKEY